MTIEASLLEQARRGQRDPLARAVSEVLRKALLAERVASQDIEDLLPLKTTKLVDILLAGRAQVGLEDAYIWRCGRMLAREHWRRQKRQLTIAAGDQIETVADHHADEPDAAAEEHELAGKVEVLREVVKSGKMPEAQRRLLVLVYVEYVDPGTLAQQDLDEHPLARDGKPRTLKQARNKVDQNLKRARDRLKELVLQAWARRMS